MLFPYNSFLKRGTCYLLILNLISCQGAESDVSPIINPPVQLNENCDINDSYCDLSYSFDPKEDRIEIRWLTLSPELELPVSINDPNSGWPNIGDSIKWKAHLFNNSQDTAFIYTTWIIDKEHKTDSIYIFPGETLIEHETLWSSEPHDVSLYIREDYSNSPILDYYTVNSHSLTIGFFVESELYNWLANEKGVSFERWAKVQVDRWNVLFENAGVIDRLRIGFIKIFDNEPQREHTADLIWYFHNQFHDERFLQENSPDNIVEDQTIVLHELLHQRGIKDLYAYWVKHNSVNGSLVLINQPYQAKKEIGSERMPLITLTTVYNNVCISHPYLMGSNYCYQNTKINPVTVYELNKFSNKRTPRHRDEYGNLLNDLNPLLAPDIPEEVELVLRNKDGRLLSNYTVDFFLDHSDLTYQNIYLEEADFISSSDSDGKVKIPSSLLETIKTIHNKTIILIIRARDNENEVWGYYFLPIHYLMLEYIQGHQEYALISGSFDIR